MDVYAKLRELGIELHDAPQRGGIYKPVRQVGNLLYISGQGSAIKDKRSVTGKVGGTVSLEEGQEAARISVLNALATLNFYLGDLNKVKGLVKMLGFVASAPGFNQQPLVMNAASKMLEDLWGENGVGARSAIGVNELPRDYAVEIEYIFEI